MNKKFFILTTTLLPLLLQASFYNEKLKPVEDCFDKNIPQIIEQSSEDKNFISLLNKSFKYLSIKCEKEIAVANEKITNAIKYKNGSESEKQTAKKYLTFDEQESLDKLKTNKKEDIYFSNKISKWESKLMILNTLSKELGKYNDKNKINLSNTDNEIYSIYKCIKDNKRVISFISRNKKTFYDKMNSYYKISDKFCNSTFVEYDEQWFLTNQSNLAYMFNNEDALTDDEAKILKNYFLNNIILFSIQ